MADNVEAFLREFAPDDVQATIAWLLDHGYVLSAQNPATGLTTFGSLFVYSGLGSGGNGLSSEGAPSTERRRKATYHGEHQNCGAAEVAVTVDRGQWQMDIARAPGGKRHQFDLLISARSGRPYWECFPSAHTADSPLPAQLPRGVSWHDTLPAVLAWLAATDETDIEAAVALASNQRYLVTWPTSAKARQLRRVWRARGLPLP